MDTARPFTPDWTRPTGPAWYQTHTLAYAEELGHDVHPIEAYLRSETGASVERYRKGDRKTPPKAVRRRGLRGRRGFRTGVRVVKARPRAPAGACGPRRRRSSVGGGTPPHMVQPCPPAAPRLQL